jgi:hypothetical protein
MTLFIETLGTELTSARCLQHRRVKSTLPQIAPVRLQPRASALYQARSPARRQPGGAWASPHAALKSLHVATIVANYLDVRQRASFRQRRLRAVLEDASGATDHY